MKTAKTAEEAAGALEARALANAAAGNRERALADAEAGLRIDPKNAGLLKIQRLLGGRERTTAAAKAVGPKAGQPPAAALPARPQTKSAKEWSELQGRRPSEAGRLFRESLEKQRARDLGAALAAAEKMIALDRNDPMGYLRRAQVLQALGRHSDAMLDLSLARRGWANDGEIAAMSANLLLQMQRFKEALAEAEEALRLSPGEAAAYWARARAKRGLGRPAEDFLRDGAEAARRSVAFEGAYQEMKALAEAEAAGGGRDRIAPVSPLPEERPEGLGRMGGSSLGERLAEKLPAGGWRWGLAALALPFIAFFGWLLMKPERRGPNLRAPTTPGGAGRVVGGAYRIDEELGQGGMGTVFKGFDANLGRYVAIKVIRADQKDSKEAKELFAREVRALSALKHPNILTVYDGFEDGGTLYLVTELVTGANLYDLAGAGPLAIKRAALIARQAGSALDHAHERGVIHRDLKTNNMMIEGERLVILDFGIAKVLSAITSPPDLATVGAGTPAFAPPEFMEGQVSREFDLYSLGAVLYHLLTGQLPFGPQGDLEAKRAGSFRPASELRQALPQGADAFFKRALAPRRNDRFHSGKELAEAFEQALSGKVAT